MALLHKERELRNETFDSIHYATRCLYGMDNSGYALDGCEFVLLMECWPDAKRQGLTLWAAWHRLRLNLVQVGARRQRSGLTQRQNTAKQRIETALERGEQYVKQYSECAATTDNDTMYGTTSLPLNAVYYEDANGYDSIDGNTPTRQTVRKRTIGN